MNALQAIREAIRILEERGRIASKILLHPTWTTRGYVFIVDHNHKAYVIVNSNDFNVAAATMVMEGKEAELQDFSFGVPVEESTSEIQKAIGGTYIWTLTLG